MVFCVNCNKLFRNTYDLNRHLSRTRPCSGNKSQENNTHNENNTLEDPNNTLEDPNNTLEDPNNTLEDPNNTLENENNTCKYCLHTFITKKYLKIHQNNCKYIDK